jgi:hypothetical protein
MSGEHHMKMDTDASISIDPGEREGADVVFYEGGRGVVRLS